MQLPDNYIDNARKVLQQVAQTARPELLAAHGNIQVELKSDHSVVTDLDKKLELQFRDALQSMDVVVPVVGEEYGGELNQADMWLIDPIDGTENFVRGLPDFRCIATLVIDNQPTYTFIYKPFFDDTYEAIKGHGATKNGQPISASQRSLERSWIVLNTPTKGRRLAIAQALRPAIKNFRSGLDFVYVAEGKADGIIACDSKGGLWDYAPRGLLLAEAGLSIVNIGADDYDFRDFNYMATSRAIFEDVRQTVNHALDVQ